MGIMSNDQDLDNLNWSDIAIGDYLAAIDVGTGTTVTIAGASVQELQTEKGKSKKVVIELRDHKAWVCCKTNRLCLEAMFGAGIANCYGKRVVLYSAEVAVGREKKKGIRIKGSPDLTKDVPVTIKLPQRGAFTVVMKATGGNREPGAEG